jgi:hypothetical protein
MGSFDPFARTVDAFLEGEAREYKSAKGRCSTDGDYFYSYEMPIGWRRVQRRGVVVEILHDGCAPTLTTSRHITTLIEHVKFRTNANTEIVYKLGARRCRKCGGRHGTGAYSQPDRVDSPGWWAPGSTRPRRTFASAEDVCEIRRAVAAAEREKEQQAAWTANLVRTSVKFHAAVRDAGFHFVVGPTYIDRNATDLKRVAQRALWVDPEVAAVLNLDLAHKLKRAVLARMKTDREFHAAVEALVAAPDSLHAFAANYAEEHVHA